MVLGRSEDDATGPVPVDDADCALELLSVGGDLEYLCLRLVVLMRLARRVLLAFPCPA